MKYRGAEITQGVVGEYTDNFYACCATCLKLLDGKFYKAEIKTVGYDHIWFLHLLREVDYPDLYYHY